MRSTRSLTLGTMAAAALLVLSACGETQDSRSEAEAEDQETTGATSSDAPAEEPAGPITLTDADGRTVELPGPAEDVVVLEWQQIEDVLSLGVTPVGVADPDGYTTWDTAEALPDGVEDMGMRGSVNKNAVLQADPDLIIVEQGPDLDTFEPTGIPVLVTAGADAADPIAQMKETFSLIAQALGKDDEAAAVIEEFDASLEEGKAAVADVIADGGRFVYADGYVMGSTLSVRPFGQGSFMGEVGEELGLTNAWEGEVDEVYGLGSTDLEGIAGVEDATLFYTGTEASTWIPELEGSDLWTNSDFVTGDRVVAFPEGIWTFGGPRSGQQVIDAYVDALT